jgi:hypothetical protein
LRVVVEYGCIDSAFYLPFDSPEVEDYAYIRACQGVFLFYFCLFSLLADRRNSIASNFVGDREFTCYSFVCVPLHAQIQGKSGPERS